MRLLLIPIAATALLALVTPRAALDDPTIIAIFDAANTYDIDTGTLALKKSHDKNVRALAQQFSNDHAAVRQQGRDLAKQLAVTPTPPKENPLAPDHLKAMKELRAKSGAGFDRAYADEEVRYHQQVLDAVNSMLLPAIQNDQLRAFVQKVGPAFQGHLEAAKQLQKTLATKTSGR